MNRSEAAMTGTIRKLIARCRRFMPDETAVAAVEFALILPLLLTLYIGSVEASRALAYDRRLTSAASTLGDLVAQTKDTLSLMDLNDYFRAAELTFTPHSPAGLRQTVTCVRIGSDGKTEVEWSQGFNGGQEHGEGDSYPLPPEFIAIAEDDSYVIVSETELAYKPLTSFIFPGGIDLRKEYFHVPRFGEMIELGGV